MADLQMTNIAKRFGSMEVIKDLSLEIRDGEFLVLVGPSGCGKSTLLRMIAGLETITAGELMIGGQRTNEVPPQKRDISMVFQSYALFPHMNVRRNIDFGPRVRGEARDAAEKSIRRASDILNLRDYLERKPGQLSGGQRQRVAMGRSIVRDPKVFLFDEPLSNLDAKLRVQMRTEIKALHQKLGTTIVYVTHDQIEAMTMADRIVVMNRGRIEQVGTPLELYDEPANLFVAGFIGSPAMSFLDARHEKGIDGPRVVLTDGTVLPVAESAADNGEDIKIGIRPETYVRDAEGPLTLTAEVVEPTGPEIHVFGTLAGTEVRAVFRDRIMPKSGETIRLSVPREHVHIFDAREGTRLGP
ncbi:MAG TPA: sn-glycerol-3-phosphate ABC transporter ATP-binding protein UgpC [Pararhizobium sp.]|nr:sn-glycerol-3-phosphate ABC transporter ATP-binding protein UgpC [Pararhizobium sp.]